MNVLKKFSSVFLILILAANFSACAGRDDWGKEASENPDNSTQTSDGGNFDPNNSGSIAPCTTNGDGVCQDTPTPTENVFIDLKNIDFGLNETAFVDCESLPVPSGYTFRAQIDSIGQKEQFGVQTSSGELSSDTVEGSGTLNVCYKRTQTGTHRGQLKVVLNSANGTTLGYVIVLNGKTLTPFFTITSPRIGQIIDTRNGKNEGRDDAEGDFLVSASGQVNTELSAVLKNGLSTPIVVESAGAKYRADIDSSGNFSIKIGVPQRDGLYDIQFSIETTQGEFIRKTIPVVVAGKPNLEIEVRDSIAGVEIRSGVPSDTENLVVGFKIPNLPSSGSSANEMPVTLSNLKFKKPDGTTVDLASDLVIHYDATKSWCETSTNVPQDLNSQNATPFKEFDVTTTYCVPLSQLGKVPTGTSVLSATAENVLGKVDVEFALILDYNKPVLTITSPREDELFPEATNQVRITGYVENHVLMSPESGKSIPDEQSGDVGSFCDQSNTDCAKSSVILWFNKNPDNLPISIFPKLPETYASLSESELISKIKAESPERCRDITATDGTTKTRCNLPRSEFSILINASELHELHRYTNILEFRAEGVDVPKSHRTMAIRTFALGHTRQQKFSTNIIKAEGNNAVIGGFLSHSGKLTTGTMGSQNPQTGLVSNAPLQLNLSQGNLANPLTKKVLEQFLNDNLPITDVLNGWYLWPKDENDKIDIEADFKQQYAERRNGDNQPYTNFNDLDPSWKEKFIQQGLHSNIMAMKAWALWRYQQYGEAQDLWTHDQSDDMFFKYEGDSQNYDVARDACNQTITTAFVPLTDMQHALKPFMNNPRDVKNFVETPYWPDTLPKNIRFNDFISGRWIVHDLSFKPEDDGTSISADICVVPENSNVTNCDQPIPNTPGMLPAIWGHFTSYNLIKNGLLGKINVGPLSIGSFDDPHMSLIWSVGKLRFKLTDVITLHKEQDDNGAWHTVLRIDKDNVASALTDSKINWMTNADKPETMVDNMEDNSIQIYPYSRCEEYYNSLLDDGIYKSDGRTHMPFGCSQNDVYKNKPFLLERNSDLGEIQYNLMHANGQSRYVNNMIWNGVIETVGKLVRCTDEEMLKPILAPQKFKSPKWAMSKIESQLTFAIDNADSGLTIALEDDAENPLVGVQADLSLADININNPLDPSSNAALTLRLPFALTANDVPRPISPFISALPLSTNTASSLAYRDGHIGRLDTNLDAEFFPKTSTNPEAASFAALSLNLEEVLNASLYTMFKKGPVSLVEALDLGELGETTNFSVGVDKVILAKNDICGNIAAGLLKTDLPPDLLFTDIKSQFNTAATHFNVILDPNSPVTISMDPINNDRPSESDPSALNKISSRVKIGVTNIQIGVHELESSTEAAHKYKIGREVVRVRIDAVLEAKIVYHKSQGRMNVFIEPFEKQSLHVTPVPGKSGASYDDVGVVQQIFTTVMKAVVAKVQKNFAWNAFDLEGTPIDATFNVDFSDLLDENGQIDVAKLDDIEFTLNAEGLTNGSCDGVNPKPEYEGTGFETPSQEDSTATDSEVISNTLIVPKLAQHNGLFFIDPCGGLISYKNGEAKESESINSILCDFGVDELRITPQIEFDNSKGYIHFSSDVILRLEEWLTGDQE